MGSCGKIKLLKSFESERRNQNAIEENKFKNRFRCGVCGNHGGHDSVLLRRHTTNPVQLKQYVHQHLDEYVNKQFNFFQFYVEFQYIVVQ